MSLSETLKMPRPIARIGQYCVSQYGDCFHRALIVADVDMNTVKVRYIDYGTVYAVSANKLYHMLSKFAHLPQQGLRGRLMNLKPALGATSWPQIARRRFLTLIKEKCLIAKIIKFDTEENVAVMGLVDTNGIEDIHINDVLYNERLADLIAEVDGEHKPDENHPYLQPLFEDLENGRGKNFADLELIDRENLFEDFANKERHISSAKQSVISDASVYSLSDTASQKSDDACSRPFFDGVLSPPSATIAEKENFSFQRPNTHMNVHPSMLVESDLNISNTNYNNSFMLPVNRCPPQFNNYVPQHLPMMEMNLGYTNSNLVPHNTIPLPGFPHNYNYSDQRIYYSPPNAFTNGVHFESNFQRMPRVYDQNLYSNPQFPQQFHHNLSGIANVNVENNCQLNNWMYPMNRSNVRYDGQLQKTNTHTLPNKIENDTYQVGEKLQNNKSINTSLNFEMGGENKQKNGSVLENITKSSVKFADLNKDTTSVNMTKSALKDEENFSVEQKQNTRYALDHKTPEYIPFSDDMKRSLSPNFEHKIESWFDRNKRGCKRESRESKLCEDMDELIIAPKADTETAASTDKVTLVKIETILNRAFEIWIWNSDKEPCVLLHQAANQLLTPEGIFKFKNNIRETSPPNLFILPNQNVTESILSNLEDDGLSGILTGETISADAQSLCNGPVLMFVPFKFFVATMRSYRPHLQVTIPELFMIAGSLTSSFKSL